MKEKEDLKQVSFMIEKELHSEFKSECAKQGVSIKSVLIDLIEKYVKENKNN